MCRDAYFGPTAQGHEKLKPVVGSLFFFFGFSTETKTINFITQLTMMGTYVSVKFFLLGTYLYCKIRSKNQFDNVVSR